MRNKVAEKLLIKKIKDYQNIIIAKHVNPDWDAQGSALGLAEIITNNFGKKNLWVVGERIDLDQNFVNKELLTERIIKSSLLITVDTANKKRIDFDKVDLAKEIFKIDHHIMVEKYETENLVDPLAASCTELITLWAGWNGLEISKSAAKYLYKGLLTDSGRFLYSQTSENTFLAAQTLVKTGIDIQEIHDQLYLSEVKIKKWQNFCFKRAKYTKFGLCYIVIKYDDYKNLSLSQQEVKFGMSDITRLKDFPISMFIIETETGEIKVSLRSWKYNIQKIAVKYNGGGHLKASGAKLESWEQMKDLIKDTNKLLKEGDK